MELKELTHEEIVVLAGLLEFSARADGVVSQDEENELNQIIEQIGEQEYRRAAQEAASQVKD